MYKELYRSLLREAAALPDSASSILYRTRIRKSFREGIQPESSTTAVKRVKQAQELLRQLKATNDGYLHALTRTLETTYARRGPGKHLLLRPFIQPPIDTIPNSFAPPLAALVTSSISHLTRPPNQSQLITPPTLPPRAFPHTEETRLLGPLTKNRIKKIRLRYFNEQIGKLRAPITVFGKRDGVELEGEELRSVLEKVGLARVDEVGGRERLERLERLAKVVDEPRAPKRLQSREERMKGASKVKSSPQKDLSTEVRREPRILPPNYSDTKWNRPRTITSRLLRRQYQAILQNSPIVTVEEVNTVTKRKSSNLEASEELLSSIEGGKAEVETKLRFSVKRSDWAKEGSRGTSQLSVEDTWWLEQDQLNQVAQVRTRREK